MTSTPKRWADYLQNVPPLARSEQSSAELFLLTTASIFGPKVVIKRTSCPDDIAREEAEARGLQNSHMRHCSWGWETEVNPQGGYDVYVFFPPHMLFSLYDEINLRGRMKNYFSEELLWKLFEYLLDKAKTPSFDCKPSLFFYSYKYHTQVWDVFDLGFDIFLYDIDPAEYQLYKDTYFSLKQYQLATLTAEGLKEGKNHVFLAGFMLLHLSLLALPKLDLQALQPSIHQNLLAVQENYSEKWVKMLQAMLETDEGLRPSRQMLYQRTNGKPPYSPPPCDDDSVDPFCSDFDLDW